MQIVASPARDKNPEAPNAQEAIRIEGVSKAYHESGGAPVLALENIDLGVPANSFVSLLGPSGCGKSTLLKLIAGIERPSSGAIYYHRRALDGINTGVAYVPQGRG